MVVTLNVTVTTAGTPVQVSTTRIPANWVNFMGAIANLGNTYFGDSNVSSTRGQALGSGGGSGSPQFHPAQTQAPTTLQICGWMLPMIMILFK